MAQILVVDDDPPIRETLRFLLEDVGYAVVEAPDGLVALQVLRASAAPMVVLLDAMMPRMNGYHVLSAVSGDPRLARHAFIMLTASPQARTIALGDLRHQMATPFLEKPFDLDEMLELVQRTEKRLRAVSGMGDETGGHALPLESMRATGALNASSE
jgi:CheY-like chemotaxis protein